MGITRSASSVMRLTTRPQMTLESTTATVHSASCSAKGFQCGGVPVTSQGDSLTFNRFLQAQHLMLT